MDSIYCSFVCQFTQIKNCLMKTIWFWISAIFWSELSEIRNQAKFIKKIRLSKYQKPLKELSMLGLVLLRFSGGPLLGVPSLYTFTAVINFPDWAEWSVNKGLLSTDLDHQYQSLSTNQILWPNFTLRKYFKKISLAAPEWSISSDVCQWGGRWRLNYLDDGALAPSLNITNIYWQFLCKILSPLDTLSASWQCLTWYRD